MKIKEKHLDAVKEFSRFAKTYETHNIIQEEVAHTLVGNISEKMYHTIVDIGCGSGAVYKNILKRKIHFDCYIALDSSEEMLVLHPEDKNVKKICANFNMRDTYQSFNLVGNSILLSSSALQWSKELDFIFENLSKKSNQVYFAIFTSNTFKTLHETANIQSPIYSVEYLKESIEKYYDVKFEVKTYKLYFETVRDMFRYIKKSGVSGGEKQLTYKQIKQLMHTYPLNYLEFEVLFVKSYLKV